MPDNEKIVELDDQELEQVAGGKVVPRVATIATLGYFKTKGALSRLLYE